MSSHILHVIGPDGDGGWEYEIIHPGCPYSVEDFGNGITMTQYECDVDTIIAFDGLAESLADSMPTKPGRYAIEAWFQSYYSHEYGSTEWDSGLTITGEVTE